MSSLYQIRLKPNLSPNSVPDCGTLKNGKQYYLKSADGRYVVVDVSKKLGFMRDVPSTGASKFTAVKKDCTVYGLCVDGTCMSSACPSDTHDFQSVRFQETNSDVASSQ